MDLLKIVKPEYLKIFRLQEQILDEIDDFDMFCAFIGSTIDNWLDRNNFGFELGDELLKKLLYTRQEVRKMLKDLDGWYTDGSSEE